MTLIPKNFFAPRHNLFFVILVTLFVLLFAAVYRPTFGFGESTMTLWKQHSDFCIPIICAIVFVSTSISRILLVLIYRRRTMTEVEYLLWQVCEWLVVCLFSDLFLCLMFSSSFLELLPKVLLVGFAILIFPYIFFDGFIARQSHHQLLQQQKQLIDDLKSRTISENTKDRLEFVDDKGIVRLVTSQQAVIYIEAAGNYVDIIYEDRGKLSHFALRNTLKGIEPLCTSHNLLRCHRSYFVNLNKIKLLRRDTNGLFAELNIDGLSDLPVSKNYANDIFTAFSHI